MDYKGILSGPAAFQPGMTQHPQSAENVGHPPYNKEYVDAFVQEHGHAPWLMCDYEAECLLGARNHPCPFYEGVPQYGGPCWTCRGDSEHCPAPARNGSHDAGGSPL